MRSAMKPIMKNEKTQYKVDIFDEPYTLVSDESAELVFKTAKLVDSLMKEIAAKAPHAETKKIAVLAALQLANQVGNLKHELEAKSEKEADLILKIDQALTELFEI